MHKHAAAPQQKSLRGLVSTLLVFCDSTSKGPMTKKAEDNDKDGKITQRNRGCFHLKNGIGEFMSLSSMTFPETSERALHIVAAETRNVSATLLGKSVKKDRLEQVGYGRKWEGFKTKVLLLLEYLNALAEKNPNDIVAFVDSDVIYAPTCQPSHILKEYDLIKKKTGAKIIFGAEVNRFETDRVDDIPYVPKWASDYKPQLVDGSFREYVRPGYNEAGLVYLNSGGFIGPTKMLKEMVEEVPVKSLFSKYHF
eukprot:jgi/Bigna1/90356/estExt_fgenesh1_pg.C_680018